MARSRLNTVFISSTTVDLQAYREAAIQVLENLHLSHNGMEKMDAGKPRPLDQCLREIRERADALVVIVARRYGWIPSEDWPGESEAQPDKSITWLESLEAQAKGIPIIPLLLEEQCYWPGEFDEEERAAQLADFRRWLRLNYTVRQFMSIESFSNALTRALDGLKNEPAATVDDLGRYVEWIAGRTRRPATVPGKSMGWDDIYVGLQGREGGKAKSLEPLIAGAPRVVLAGGPGSGKSAVLMKYAWDLASRWKSAAKDPVPVVLTGGEFWDHITHYAGRDSPGVSASLSSPSWVSHYLSTLSDERGWGVSGESFEAMLKDGRCVILFDGLEQADADTATRLIREVSLKYERSRMIVSGRTWAVTEADLDGFARVDIAPLDNARIRQFLLKWCGILEPRSDRAQHRARVLYEKVTGSERTRRFARNPLLLTVMINAQGEMPVWQTRADFYEDVLAGMVRKAAAPAIARAQEPLEILQELAWAMQTSQPPKVRAAMRWAGEMVAEVMGARSVSSAAKYLESLVDRTGVLSADRDTLQFWHPTGQEYLAARKLAYTPSAERMRLLDSEVFDSGGSDQWRQVVLFLGELLQDDERQTRDLLNRLIEKCESSAVVSARAHCAATLAALERHVESLPENYRERCRAVLLPFRDLFSAGDLGGIDVRTRVELAEAIGSAGLFAAEMRWVEIPSGAFWMGAQKRDAAAPRYDPDAHGGEAPVRKVDLDSYAISRYPVMVAQYDEFIRDGGYARAEFWAAGGSDRWSSPLRWGEQLEQSNRPVTGVSWYEAAAFCAWAGGRLPTEAEWERAAAGCEGRRFPWGDAVPNHSCANFDRKFGGIVAAGLFPERATPEGVNDLAGNVWEWVLDGFGPYQAEPAPVRNPRGPNVSAGKVLRGGSYQNGWRFLRTSERIHARPEERYSHFGNTGFRCARPTGASKGAAMLA